MMQFIKRISFFKWNWSNKQKLTIEAEMKRDDFKKFLSDNKIKTDGDLNAVHKAEIVIKIKGRDE